MIEKVNEIKGEERGRIIWSKIYRCDQKDIIEKLIARGFRCETVSMADDADVGMKSFGGIYGWDEFCELYPDVSSKAEYVSFQLPDVNGYICFDFTGDRKALLCSSRADLELEDFLSKDWKIDWNSGLFDEINLVYEKVDANEKIQLLLTELEIFALQEAMEACQEGGILSRKNRGAVLTQEEFLKLPEIDKETAIVMLGEDGLDYGKDGMSAFSINRQTATITVNFSQLICETHACTMFDVLNRLEKIDGTNNVGGASKWTLELHAPAEAEKKIALWNHLIEQLYPWITVKVCLSKEAAKQPKESDRGVKPHLPLRNENSITHSRAEKRNYILSVIIVLGMFVTSGILSLGLALSSNQTSDLIIGLLFSLGSFATGAVLVWHFTNDYRNH